MDDEPLTTVWEVRVDEASNHQPGALNVSTKLFETREAAEASCPTDGEVKPKIVRRAPLAMQTRWLTVVDSPVGKPDQYVVDETHPHFGAPATLFTEWGGDTLCHAPTPEEAVARAEKEERRRRRGWGSFEIQLVPEGEEMPSREPLERGEVRYRSPDGA